MVRFSQKHLDPLRALEPPVPEEFRVVGRDDDRRPPHCRGGRRELARSLGDEVRGMRFDPFGCALGIVDVLLAAGAGHAVVLETGRDPDPGCRQERVEILEREIETQVAVKVAIEGVAGVAFDGAPHLARRLGVAAEGGHACGRDDRCEGGVERSRRRFEEPVRLDQEPANAVACEDLLEARYIAAFRQPEAERVTAEEAPVLVDSDRDLRLDRGGLRAQCGQEPVGRSAGDDLETTRLLVSPEGRDEFAAQGLDEERARARQQVAVEQGDTLHAVVSLVAPQLFFREGATEVEVANTARLQQSVGQHVEERRTDREGEAVGQVIDDQAVENAQQRDVGFGDCLEEPALLEEVIVLRVAHEGQVRVQDEREGRGVVFHHGDLRPRRLRNRGAPSGPGVPGLGPASRRSRWPGDRWRVRAG